MAVPSLFFTIDRSYVFAVSAETTNSLAHVRIARYVLPASIVYSRHLDAGRQPVAVADPHSG